MCKGGFCCWLASLKDIYMYVLHIISIPLKNPTVCSCPTDGTLGLFEDPTDCSRYCVCTTSGPSLGQCPNGGHFSVSLKQCRPPSEANCELPGRWSLKWLIGVLIGYDKKVGIWYGGLAIFDTQITNFIRPKQSHLFSSLSIAIIITLPTFNHRFFHF